MNGWEEKMEGVGQLVFLLVFFFFFNDTATTEIYTLSLHDALPISKVPYLEKGGSNGFQLRN